MSRLTRLDVLLAMKTDCKVKLIAARVSYGGVFDVEKNLN